MRSNSRPAVVATITAGMAVLGALIVGQPVFAQTGTGSTVVTYKPLPKISIRGGVYFPVNTVIRHNVGDTMVAAGADYVINRQGASTAWYGSVDYIDRSSGGYKLQLVPITFGMLHYSDVTASTRTYAGWGIGAYPVDQEIPDYTGATEVRHTTLFGGYLNLGMEFPQNIFIDARYHITTTVGSANPGGLELTAGIRF